MIKYILKRQYDAGEGGGYGVPRNTLPRKKCRLKLWSTILFLPVLSLSSSRRVDAFYFLVWLALGDGRLILPLCAAWGGILPGCRKG